MTIQAKFRDFDSLQECIDDLVTKWYWITRDIRVLIGRSLLGSAASFWCKSVCHRPALRCEADEHYQSASMKKAGRSPRSPEPLGRATVSRFESLDASDYVRYCVHQDGVGCIVVDLIGFE